tara:strand:+ start:1808 stop:3352 length:1545 start_codon:yes stop_codon:yes gene_type:complete
MKLKENQETEKLNSSLKFLAKGSTAIFLGLALSKLFSYFYRILIARYFGPEIYGFFTISLMVSGLFITFAYLGLSDGVVRYISIYRGKNDKNAIRQIYRVSSKFLIISGSISFILMFMTSEYIALNIFHNPDLIIFLKIFSLAIPLTIFMTLYSSIALSYGRVKSYSFIHHFLLNSLKLGFLVLFIMIGLGSNSLIFSYLAAVLITGLAFYFVARHHISELFEKENLDKKSKNLITKNLFSYSWPFLFSAIVTALFYWTDSFMIGFFNSPLEVGLYNAAIPIALLLTMTSELFGNIFFPLIAKEYSKKNILVIRELTKQVGKWVFLINIPLLGLILLFPTEFITILFGEQYLVAKNSLRILSVGMFAASLFVFSNKLISVAGKSKLILFDTLLVAIINLILNFYLIPRYGIEGAAFSTTISLILINLIFLFQANYFLKIIPLRRTMKAIFLAVLAPTLFLFLFKNSFNQTIPAFIIQSIFLLLSYTLLIILFKGLDRNDFLIITSLRNKIKKRE